MSNPFDCKPNEIEYSYSVKAVNNPSFSWSVCHIIKFHWTHKIFCWLNGHIMNIIVLKSIKNIPRLFSSVIYISLNVLLFFLLLISKQILSKVFEFRKRHCRHGSYFSITFILCLFKITLAYFYVHSYYDYYFKNLFWRNFVPLDVFLSNKQQSLIKKMFLDMSIWLNKRNNL